MSSELNIFQKFVGKIQQLTLTVDIFLKVSTTDSVVFFQNTFSRTAILTQTSVITCKWIF